MKFFQATLFLAATSLVDPTAAQDALNFTLPEYTQAAIEDSSSPQTKALRWLEGHPDLSQMDAKRQMQLLGLGTIFHSLSGHHWLAADEHEWMNYEVHECQWPNPEYLVAPGPCLDGSYYDTLNLISNERLMGTLPPEVALLESLRSISIVANPSLGKERARRSVLADMLPTQLGTLSLLTSLEIGGHAKLGGSIPSQISYLSTLTHLDLTSNEFTGSLPPQLFDLSNINKIWLSYNSFTGGIPTQIGNMKKLDSFVSYRNYGVTGPIPSELGTITGLININFEETSLDSTIPSELGLATTLRNINLQNTLISGIVPSELSNLKNLTSMLIHNTSLTGSLPVEFCGNDEEDQPLFLDVVMDCTRVECPNTCSIENNPNASQLHLFDDRTTCNCHDHLLFESESSSATLMTMRTLALTMAASSLFVALSI